MEINDLRYFIRALELENISRAAASLGITQPALSRQIRTLEDELGQRLLVRTGRGVRPTEAGRRFASDAARILEDVDGLKAVLRNSMTSPSGAVSLAMPTSISDALLPELFVYLGREYPDIRLKVIEALSTTSADLLRNRSVDLAIQYHRADMGSLHWEKLIDEPLSLVSAPGSAPAPDHVDFSTVERIRLILPSRNSGLRRMLEQEALHRGLKLNVAVEIESVSAMKNLVMAGLGHCILPHFSIAREVVAGLLTARRIGEPFLNRGIVISRLAHRPPSITATKVIQAIRLVAAQCA